MAARGASIAICRTGMTAGRGSQSHSRQTTLLCTVSPCSPAQAMNGVGSLGGDLGHDAAHKRLARNRHLLCRCGLRVGKGARHGDGFFVFAIVWSVSGDAETSAVLLGRLLLLCCRGDNRQQRVGKCADTRTRRRRYASQVRSGRIRVEAPMPRAPG